MQVTIPEGLTVPEILGRLADAEGREPPLDRAELEQLLASGQVRSVHQPAGQASMEGFLFPDTYRFEPDVDALAVLKRLVGETDSGARRARTSRRHSSASTSRRTRS